MRTKNAIKNISISMISQIIIILLGFISRKVFLDSLGSEYLGVNGLIDNILSVVVIIESGIGISIVYNLYKPLAEDNREKIIALVKLYKKTYSVLALIIFIMSCAIYPFIGYIMKGNEVISGFSIVYSIFVAKNIINYLNAHKIALINADQKGYIIARNNLIFQILTTISKIVILTVTQNYIAYLLIELIIYIIQTVINTMIVNRRYPYIRAKEDYALDIETKINMKKNVKAMFFHNIGGYLVFSTDNLLISSFISVASVGIYSNYTMIMGQLSSLLRPILNGIGHSVGNLIATEGEEKNYFIFNIVYLINFWIYSMCVVFLYNLLEPFIKIWIGEQYLFASSIFILILTNFYLNGMRNSISTFKNKAGLFSQDKYASIIEGVINLISSLLLIPKLGIAGVFLGTTISTLSVVFWVQPIIVYKNVFKKPVSIYFTKYIMYIILTIGTCFITKSICSNFVNANGLLGLVVKGTICLIITNIIYILIFYRSSEFKYVYDLLKTNFISFKSKLVLSKVN